MKSTTKTRQIEKELKPIKAQIVMSYLETINNFIESMKGSTLYRHKLKLHSKGLQQEIEKNIDILFSDLTQEQTNQISTQYVGMNRVSEMWIILTVMFTLHNSGSSLVALNNDITMLFQKYDKSGKCKEIIDYLNDGNTIDIEL